jgi:hypothetical protein
MNSTRPAMVFAAVAGEGGGSPACVHVPAALRSATPCSDGTVVPPSILVDTVAKVSRLNLYLAVVSKPAAQSEWLDAAALTSPGDGALAHLLEAFKEHGIAPNRKAASASLLLRLGWAGGFAIGAYLACRRVPILRAYAVSFSEALLLQSMWVRDVLFVGAYDDPLAGATGWSGSVETSELPKMLLQSLVAFTEPIVATQHAWSGFSRHALWAMATSSWAEQFTNVARQIGDESRGFREATAFFELVPELKRAAPVMYTVQGGRNARTCQRRSACCLYFKNSARHFCPSCPIIPEVERLERNRTWVASQSVCEQRSS